VPYFSHRTTFSCRPLLKVLRSKKHVRPTWILSHSHRASHYRGLCVPLPPLPGLSPPFHVEFAKSVHAHWLPSLTSDQALRRPIHHAWPMFRCSAPRHSTLDVNGRQTVHLHLRLRAHQWVLPHPSVLPWSLSSPTFLPAQGHAACVARRNPATRGRSFILDER
jgi:hypothetical protein